MKINFWKGLALLYFILALVSAVFSCKYSKKMRSAKAKFYDGVDKDGKPYTALGAGSNDETITLDYWGELVRYLNITTVINAAGFVLAAIAAFTSSY